MVLENYILIFIVRLYFTFVFSYLLSVFYLVIFVLNSMTDDEFRKMDESVHKTAIRIFAVLSTSCVIYDVITLIY